jgi:lipopolysaccharide/colanic/teichoic acid biosynthesis glycosyltransferase
MSFVGPRALRPVEQDAQDAVPVAVWDIEGFSERSRVRPGLTGIAQIFAPRDITRSEKFKYDIWYIQHHSICLDARLILLSFFITCRARWERRDQKLACGFRFDFVRSEK